MTGQRPACSQDPGVSGEGTERWDLRLYVAGQTPKCVEAFANLKRICEEYLRGCYTIELIDLVENPTLGRDHQIVALPTVVRKLPQPLRKIIGTLTDEERVLVGLDLMERKRPSRAPPAPPPMGHPWKPVMMRDRLTTRRTAAPRRAR